MKYMGSKNRHSRAIIQHMGCSLIKNQFYVEPFCGGCNLIDKIEGKRIASDIDEDLICMWQAVSEGWMPPPAFTEEQYNEIKSSDTSPLKGYAAFALSYAGKKFGGWCRDGEGKRNYVDEAYRNAIKQFPRLRGVDFRLCNYFDLEIPKGSTVYCDPPYAGTTGYKSNFDHEKFWDWVRYICDENHNDVYVSEYNAPDDFSSVWEKNVTSSLTENTGSKIATEKLFIRRIS